MSSEDEAPLKFAEVEGGKKQEQDAVDDSPTRYTPQSAGSNDWGIQIESRRI